MPPARAASPGRSEPIPGIKRGSPFRQLRDRIQERQAARDLSHDARVTIPDECAGEDGEPEPALGHLVDFGADHDGFGFPLDPDRLLRCPAGGVDDQAAKTPGDPDLWRRRSIVRERVLDVPDGGVTVIPLPSPGRKADLRIEPEPIHPGPFHDVAPGLADLLLERQDPAALIGQGFEQEEGTLTHRRLRTIARRPPGGTFQEELGPHLPRGVVRSLLEGFAITLGGPEILKELARPIVIDLVAFQV